MHAKRLNFRAFTIRAVSGLGEGNAQHGFTLFEVAISLVLVAFGVISVMMLFPMGIKAEQMARLRLFAAVKAEEMVDVFANAANDNPGIDIEAPNQWEVPAGHRPFVPDLEGKVATSRYGIMPVPRDIAMRLESDNDEIRSILSRGGELYYSKPTAASGIQEATESGDSHTALNSVANAAAVTDPLLLLMVFAVNGYAQNNTVSHLAQKKAPYYVPYPGPPAFGYIRARGKAYHPNVEQPKKWSTDVTFPYIPYSNQLHYTVNNGEHYFTMFEGVDGGIPIRADETPTGSLDLDMQVVFTNGYRPYAVTSNCDYILNWGGDIRVQDHGDFNDYERVAYEKALNPAINPDYETRYVPLFYRQQLGAERYIQSARWYCMRKALDRQFYEPARFATQSDAMTAAAVAVNYFRNSVPDREKWKYVNAMRFLSHAATCISKFARDPGNDKDTKSYIRKNPLGSPLGSGPDQPAVNPRMGITIPRETVPHPGQKQLKDRNDPALDVLKKGSPPEFDLIVHAPVDPRFVTLEVPEITIDHNTLVFFHEVCMGLVMDYTVHLPYDWGAARPLQRAVFTDHPLIEYDLFTDPNVALGSVNSGKIIGSDIGENGTPGGVDAKQWKPIPASPIFHIGRSSSYPGYPIPANDGAADMKLWGNSSHFTISKLFEPAERCRQMVFWAVNWMAYEDFETAPAAPIDSSRFPFVAPQGNDSPQWMPFDNNVKALDHYTVEDPKKSKAGGYDRMGFARFADLYIFSFRHPEYPLFWTGDLTSVPTGYSAVADFAANKYDFYNPGVNPRTPGMYNADAGARNNARVIDMASLQRTKQMFSGAFGADRNFNNMVDRGSLPKSARLRATTLARFNFYDPRLVLKLR